MQLDPNNAELSCKEGEKYRLPLHVNPVKLYKFYWTVDYVLLHVDVGWDDTDNSDMTVAVIVG